MDAFQTLKDGCSFDRKRFAADIELFCGEPEKRVKVDEEVRLLVREAYTHCSESYWNQTPRPPHLLLCFLRVSTTQDEQGP
jgi:hypothetical protein